MIDVATLAYDPLPVSILPEPLQSYIRQGARALGCDPAYVALPLLSAVGSAIGNTRRIQLKRTWSEPAIVWTAVVGESGTVKSPALDLALHHVRRVQDLELRRHGEAMQLHETEQMTYDRDVAAWKRSKRSNDPPIKPEEPKARRLICGDATVESLAVLLEDNPRGLLLARDELSGWVGSFDQYSKGKGADAAHWLSMWSGGQLLVDRKTGDRRMIHVPRAAVSITGTIQPQILQRVLGLEHFENGMAARLLVAKPPRRAKRWTEAEVAQDVEDRVGKMFDRLHSLVANTTADGFQSPVLATLTPEAKDVWVNFCNAHAEEQAALTGHMAAAWAKLEAYCARFALLIHFVRWADHDPTLNDPDRVDEQSVACAEQLVRWFKGQIERVYGTLGETDDERVIRQTIEMIQARGGSISVRDYQRTSRRFANRPDLARQDLKDLEALGYGWLETIVPGEDGGRPSEVFELAPEYGGAAKTLDSGLPAGVLATAAPAGSDTAT